MDLLVVDGNSSDGTGKIADELAGQHPQIHVLHEQKKTAWAAPTSPGSNGRWKTTTNSSSRWTAIFPTTRTTSRIFWRPRRNADLVLGSRYVGGIRVINWPLSRLMLSRLRRQLCLLITGMPFTDPTGGYKCFRRRALQAINLDEVRSNGYSFQIEMTHRLWREGFKVAEVPIIFTDRIAGQSKMSRGIVNEAFWLVWRLWLQNGLRRSPRVKKQPPESNKYLPNASHDLNCLP